MSRYSCLPTRSKFQALRTTIYPPLRQVASRHRSSSEQHATVPLYLRLVYGCAPIHARPGFDNHWANGRRRVPSFSFSRRPTSALLKGYQALGSFQSFPVCRELSHVWFLAAINLGGHRPPTFAEVRSPKASQQFCLINLTMVADLRSIRANTITRVIRWIMQHSLHFHWLLQRLVIG